MRWKDRHHHGRPDEESNKRMQKNQYIHDQNQLFHSSLLVLIWWYPSSRYIMCTACLTMQWCSMFIIKPYYYAWYTFPQDLFQNLPIYDVTKIKFKRNFIPAIFGSRGQMSGGKNLCFICLYNIHVMVHSLSKCILYALQKSIIKLMRLVCLFKTRYTANCNANNANATMLVKNVIFTHTWF